MTRVLDCQEKGIEDYANIDAFLELRGVCNSLAQCLNLDTRRLRLRNGIRLKDHKVHVDPVFLPVREIARPTKKVFLPVKAAYNDANEQVKKEEGAENHETDEEEDPVRVAPLPPDIVNFSYLCSRVHKVCPAGNIRDDKERGDGLVHVVKVVIVLHPVTT